MFVEEDTEMSFYASVWRVNSEFGRNRELQRRSRDTADREKKNVLVFSAKKLRHSFHISVRRFQQKLGHFLV